MEVNSLWVVINIMSHDQALARRLIEVLSMLTQKKQKTLTMQTDTTQLQLMHFLQREWNTSICIVNVINVRLCIHRDESITYCYA